MADRESALMTAHEKRKEQEWQAIPGWKKNNQEIIVANLKLREKRIRISSAPSIGTSKILCQKKVHSEANKGVYRSVTSNSCSPVTFFLFKTFHQGYSWLCQLTENANLGKTS